jgi:hypothetical protein
LTAASTNQCTTRCYHSFHLLLQYALTIEFYREIEAKDADNMNIREGGGGAFGFDIPNLVGDTIADLLDQFDIWKNKSRQLPKHTRPRRVPPKKTDSGLFPWLEFGGLPQNIPGAMSVLGLLRAVNLTRVYHTSTFINVLYDGDSSGAGLAEALDHGDRTGPDSGSVDVNVIRIRVLLTSSILQ